MPYLKNGKHQRNNSINAVFQLKRRKLNHGSGPSAAVNFVSLQHLPLELLVQIFVLSENPYFPFVCRRFFNFFKSGEDGSVSFARLKFLDSIFAQFRRRKLKKPYIDPCCETLQYAILYKFVTTVDELIDLEAHFKRYGYEQFVCASLVLPKSVYSKADSHMDFIQYLTCREMKLSDKAIYEACKKQQYEFLNFAKATGDLKLFIQTPPLPIYCIFRKGKIDETLFELVCGVYSFMATHGDSKGVIENAKIGLNQALHFAARSASWVHVDRLISFGAQVDSTLVLELERQRSC